jgi:hypothetical protein
MNHRGPCWIIKSAVLTAVILFLQCDQPAGPAPLPQPDPPQGNASITVTAPNGGQVYAKGDTVAIMWTANSDSVTAAILEITFNDGMTWVSMLGNRSVHPFDADWGNCQWVIPDTLNDFATGKRVPVQASDQCRIKIWDYNRTNIFDETDAPFTIQPR